MNIAIILSGGIGTRMGNITLPKQYLEIYGKPILVHTLEMFEMGIEIDEIVVVAEEKYFQQIEIYKRQYDLTKIKLLVKKGDTRQLSVYNALLELRSRISDDDIIVVHDAVRPLVTAKIINDSINTAKKYGTCDPVVRANDTIVVTDDKIKVTEIPNRNRIYLSQTPQSFKYSILLAAHNKAITETLTNFTDDSQLLLHYQVPIYMCEGDPLNFKITHFSDITLLKALLKLGRLSDY